VGSLARCFSFSYLFIYSRDGSNSEICRTARRAVKLQTMLLTPSWQQSQPSVGRRITLRDIRTDTVDL
jgi:hypothetical protein